MVRCLVVILFCLLTLPLPGSAEKVVLTWEWPENATMTYVQGVHIYFGLNGTDGVLDHKKHTVHGTGNQTVINIPGGRNVVIYATSWGRAWLTNLESNASEPLYYNTNNTMEGLLPVGGNSAMPAGGASRIQ